MAVTEAKFGRSVNGGREAAVHLPLTEQLDFAIFQLRGKPIGEENLKLGMDQAPKRLDCIYQESRELFLALGVMAGNPGNISRAVMKQPTAVLPASRPLFRDVHHRRIQHFEKAVTRGNTDLDLVMLRSWS